LNEETEWLATLAGVTVLCDKQKHAEAQGNEFSHLSPAEVSESTPQEE